MDGTFELKTNYLGLNDAREETFTGNFTWDETGSIVQLQGLIGDAPGKYKVGENQIWHLDKNGNRIEGALADRYILRKK
ncbi:copper resistance protein NlpE N-terminal domain-containing protein [Algoriphagus boritolerans]|uniref:copper resistance protein NlpE N-terminal domain-containing protein n=1 Tax=Algoriphagus boritolerans TaxID=308111 RepID=UPI000B3251BE